MVPQLLETGPLPAWWNPSHERAWARAAEELERMTRRQLASGTLPPFPGAAESILSLDHDVALVAVRLGHAAASYYVDETVWSDELEMDMCRDWTVMRTGVPWSRVRGLARQGWQRARDEMLAVV
jgi:hypothetical protein